MRRGGKVTFILSGREVLVKMTGICVGRDPGTPSFPGPYVYVIPSGSTQSEAGQYEEICRNVISALCQIIGQPQGAAPASALTPEPCLEAGEESSSVAPHAWLGNEVLKPPCCLCLGQRARLRAAQWPASV